MHYRNALITGASSGLGRELARQLVRQGTHVVVAARRLEELEALVDEVKAAGGQAEALRLDVADTEATRAAIQALDERLGGLELVIANAGIGEFTNGRVLDHKSVERVFQVNLMGAIASLTAVLPRMVSRNRGHLAAVSSLAAYSGLPDNAAYCGSKAGLGIFLEALRIDLLKTGVRVTTINPGFVRTPLTANSPYPMPFMVEVEDAAALILRKLPKAPARIEFPRPIAWSMRLLRWLPQWLADLVMTRAMGR